MLRMRTIEQAYKDIKAEDKDTAITPFAIRQLILNNQIPHIKRGKKYLLNLDMLIAYLDGQFEPEEKSGGIRAVER